jgi:hypothetical protein
MILASDLNTSIAEYLPILLSQASPVYPLRISTELGYQFHPFKWIDQDKTFQKWLARKDTCILHVHGTSGVSKASEYIFHHHDSSIDSQESDRAVLYFEFKQHDARFNTIQSMLRTFLAQIISHYHSLDTCVVNNFERLCLYHDWTNKDLYSFFEDLRTAPVMDSIIYVISGLDQCDESCNWFLVELLSIARCSESRYKIVITSAGSKDIQDALSDFPTINLDEHANNGNSTPDKPLWGLGFELMQLMQERPQYRAFETTLRGLLSEWCR